MKKYVKPELFYESFELNQQIAACQFDSNNTSTDEGCAFTGFDAVANEVVTIFLESTTACTVKADSYCYHNAAFSPYGIFNS